MAYQFEICRDDILNTYIGDEVADAQTYDAVIRMSTSHTAYSISQALGISPAKAGRYIRGSKPRGLKGVDKLIDMGLFPVSLRSGSFDLFHTLSSMTYWRGRITRRNDTSVGTFAHPLINPTDEKQRGFINRFLEQADIPARDVSRGGIALPNEISRLMVVAGHGVGKKTETDGTIPKYVVDAIKSYEQGTDDPAHLKLISEFVRAMIFFRLKQYDTASIAHLYALRDEEAATSQAELIHKATKIALPESSVEIRGPYESDDSFRTRIAFTGDDSQPNTIKSTYAEETLTRFFKF